MVEIPARGFLEEASLTDATNDDGNNGNDVLRLRGLASAYKRADQRTTPLARSSRPMRAISRSPSISAAGLVCTE